MKLKVFYGLAMITASVSAQDIYRWIDKDGIVKYSDKIPAHIKMEDVTKVKTTPDSSFKSVKQIAKEQGKTPSQQQQELEQISKGNCDVAIQNLKLLTAFKDVRLQDENGVEVVLTEEEKAEQVSLVKKQMAIYCDN